MELTRHLDLIDPRTVTDKIHIIGAGAIGSWVALSLAKLGFTDINVYDFDVVEAHNVPNQAFGIEHIGMLKVDALKAIIEAQTGTSINTFNRKVEGGRFAGIVLMCVDSMTSRKKLYESCIKMKSQVKLLIETRMGLSTARMYTVNPIMPKHFEKYETSLYSDEEATVSACGVSRTVITTALFISACAVRQVINFYNEIDLDNEVIYDLAYNNTFPTMWK